ncbi:hypothetical protein Tco_0834573 [Tanacetum coccineum]
MKDQPLPADASPIALSLGYIADSDPEEDEEDPDEDPADYPQQVVQNCSKQCLESFKTLQKNFDSKREKHNRAKLEIQGYELALESLESRILGHEKNKMAWGEKYEFQNYDLKCLDEFAIRKKIIESKTTELKTDTSKSKTSKTVGNTNEVNIEKPKSVYESVVSTPNINKEKVIIEDWNSDDEDDVSEVIPKTQTVKTQVDKIGHYRSDCPELKNRNHGNQAEGTEARGMVYALEGGDTDQDLNNIEDEIEA